MKRDRRKRDPVAQARRIVMGFPPAARRVLKDFAIYHSIALWQAAYLAMHGCVEGIIIDVGEPEADEV